MSMFREQVLSAVRGVEFSNSPASAETVQSIQKKLGMAFGAELKCYLMEFGYVANGATEFYGVNERQGMASDMVAVSDMLHADFPATSGLVAIENLGDDVYALCDTHDRMYEFVMSPHGRLRPCGKTLSEYVVARLRR